MVSMLAVGFFSGEKIHSMPSLSQNPGFTWKSKPQAKLTGHFSPVIPSFADRGLSCRLHVEAPRGECSVSEPYRSPDWALVPAKTGLRAEY